MSNDVAIVGYGAVGRGIKELFPSAVIYDEPLGLGAREDASACKYAFVAVPTPPLPDGGCDTSIIDSVLSWLQSDIIVIRSTVAVGTTDRLRKQHGKRVIFQPEYGPGETPDHQFKNARDIRWVILGGDRKDTIEVADLYKTTFRADIVIQQTDARTAELAKYMENAFLALKVTFCNELYDIAGALDVDYNELRELWLLDPRMGRSHTFVHPASRGFGGRCLPKDLDALIHSARASGCDPILLPAVAAANTELRKVSR
jgi:UDPglucose 6-dehydrogenase